jgi:hypothetical protein
MKKGFECLGYYSLKILRKPNPSYSLLSKEEQLKLNEPIGPVDPTCLA